MNSLSDVTNDEVRELVESIRRKTNTVIDGETVRQWSREDIERLLAASRRADAAAEEEEIQEDEPVEETEEIIETEAEPETVPEEPAAEDYSEIVPSVDDLPEDDEEDVGKSVSEKVRDMLNEEPEEEKKTDFKGALSGAKEKMKSFAGKIRSGSKNLAETIKNSKALSDDELDEDGFEDGADEKSEADAAPVEEDDGDVKIADFSKPKDKKEDVAEDGGAEEKTTHFSTTGKTAENAENSSGDSVDTSVEDTSEKDAKTKKANTEKTKNDIENQIREATEAGQMVMDEYVKENTKISQETDPVKMEEEKAEQELFENRKEKIENFILFGEANDPYAYETEKERIDDLFYTPEDKPEPKTEKNFDAVEYEQPQDARKVSRYLMFEKKKIFNRTIILAVLFALSFIVSIKTALDTTVGGDRILTIFENLIVSVGAMAVCNQRIIRSFQLLKKKVINVNTLISISAVICFLQTLLMFVLYFFGNNPVSVFGCTGIALLLLGELNAYVTNRRTSDALKFCSDENNKNSLYSIERISDSKDAVELGKNTRSKVPKLRYSCKTNFPSHLVELCMSETSADRRAVFYFTLMLVASLIDFVVAWAVNKSVVVGFAAFAITMVMCAPAYAPLLIQLPLRWINARLNREGSLVSSQKSVNDLYRTNGILIDSKELFDQDACEILFKETGSSRTSYARQYAAEMCFRSVGPLSGAFDRLIGGDHSAQPTVKTLSYEEKMGVSCWINNQKVVLGNKVMMENHSVEFPKDFDEEKYLLHGDIMYLAIANKLAAVIAAKYVPNREVSKYLEKLRDSGVSVLIHNCDQNVTEKMIEESFDMKLDNIKVINSASGRVFRKYKPHTKVSSRAVAIHDGSVNTFMSTLCSAAVLHHAFKVSDALAVAGIAISFLMVLVLSILNVIADLPVVFVLLMQIILTVVSVGISRITCGK